MQSQLRTYNQLRTALVQYRITIDQLSDPDATIVIALSACLARDRIESRLHEYTLGLEGVNYLVELHSEDQRFISLLRAWITTDREELFRAICRSRNPPTASWWWHCADTDVENANSGTSVESLLRLLTTALLLFSLVGGLVLALRLSQSEVSLTNVSTYLQVLLPILAATALTNVGRQLADTLLQTSGVKVRQMTGGRLGLALVLFSFVILIFLTLPARATLHNNIGSRAFERNEYVIALDEFKQAASLDPNSAPAYYNLANTYEELNRTEEAIFAYRQALDRSAPLPRLTANSGLQTPSPTWFAATNNLAQLLAIYGDDTDIATAIAIVSRAFVYAAPEYDPAIQAALYRTRAYAYLSLGLFHNASDDLATATRLAPTAAATGCVIGFFYESEKNPFRDQEAAMEGWFTCLSATPSDRIPAFWSAVAQERYRSSQ